MRALFTLFLCVFLSSCGEPAASTLFFTMKSANGTGSEGRFLVSTTGVISESGVQGDDGSGRTRRITIDKIEDDGITLTVSLTIMESAKPPRELKKQMFVPYGQDTTVAQLSDMTLTAHLERNQ